MPLPLAFLQSPRLTCTHGALTLSLRPNDGVPGEFRVRVTSRPKDNPFESALILRPGTVLRLCRGKRGVCWVTVRYFEPTIQYGRFCASGKLVVDI